MPRPGSDTTKGIGRDREAARLKAVGWTMDEITAHLRYEDEAACGAGIKRAIAIMARFGNDEHRLMELQSLDQLEWEAWELMRKRHVMISHGKIIRDDLGNPMADQDYPIRVMNMIMKIKERRAKLLGLDAPVRAEVFTMEHIDQQIAQLEQELGLRG
jgi:hypothetical protein